MEKILDNYLNNKNIDYAILVNAGWGVGKTYFMKKYKEEYKGEKEIIYLSLYDVDDIVSLEDKLYNQILKNSDSKEISKNLESHVFKKFKVIGAEMLKSQVEKKTGVNFDITYENFKKLHRDTVNLCDYHFIFDDLERSNCNVLKILALASEIIEQGAKIIFVAHEAELLLKLKSNLIDYNRVKEKVIFETLEFRQDSKIVLNNLLPKEKKDFNNIIREIEYSSNLRTTKYFITKAEVCYEEIIKSKLLDDFKRVEVDAILNQFFREFYKKILDLKEPKEKKNKEDSWESIVTAATMENFSCLEKYFNESKLDKFLFIADVKKYLELGDFPLYDENALKEIYNNYYMLSEKKINCLLNLVKKRLGNKEYEVKYFWKIIYSFVKLKYIGFDIDINSVISDIKLKIEDSIETSFSDNIPFYLLGHGEIINGINIKIKLKEIFTDIDRFISESNEKVKVNRWKELDYSEVSVNEWLDTVPNINFDIFDSITPEILVEIYLKSKNDKIEILRNKIECTSSTKADLEKTIELLERTDRENFDLIKKMLWEWVIGDFKRRVSRGCTIKEL